MAIERLLELSGLNEISHQHGDGEWPDASRYGRNGRGDGRHRIEVDISNQAAICAVYSDIDHDGTGCYHLSGHEPGFADSDNQDLRCADLVFDVACARVTNSYRGV